MTNTVCIYKAFNIPSIHSKSNCYNYDITFGFNMIG